MAMLMINCPVTGRPVATGIEIEPDTLARLPNIGSGLTCPHCGHHHIWKKRDAWLNGPSACLQTVKSPED